MHLWCSRVSLYLSLIYINLFYIFLRLDNKLISYLLIFFIFLLFNTVNVTMVNISTRCGFKIGTKFNMNFPPRLDVPFFEIVIGVYIASRIVLNGHNLGTVVLLQASVEYKRRAACYSFSDRPIGESYHLIGDLYLKIININLYKGLTASKVLWYYVH